MGQASSLSPIATGQTCALSTRVKGRNIILAAALAFAGVRILLMSF